MIISASRKTDLPTFYSDWFRYRLQAGYCKIVNTYDRRRHRTVSLLPEDVDGFVFWTKDVGPFLPALDEVSALGKPFVVQYSINPYPRTLEAAVIDDARAAEHCHRLAEEFGPRVVVWRYDPILLTGQTPLAYHLSQFERLAGLLAGSTDEVVTKFVVPYRKTRRNLDRASAHHGLDWWEPAREEKLELLQRLADCAGDHGMTLRICCQPELLTAGLGSSVCIDADRLADVGGKSFPAKPQPSRDGCGCAASIDIGEYDTCPHGCAYCYAVRRQAVAQQRYRSHNPLGEYLFTPDTPADAEGQLALF
jgi:hypothetical protein